MRSVVDRATSRGHAIAHRPRHRRGLAALIASVGLVACSSPGHQAAASPPCGSRSTVQYATHADVDPDLTSLDLYVPPADQAGCTLRPMVVWVHGGGWTSGDKGEYMTDKVALFNGAGYLFASVNYRLTDPALVPPAPQYPVHDDDVATAIAWLIDHASDYGGDPRKVAVLGHSAGGGIVAAITTDPQYLQAHGETLGSVDCAGSMDGEGYDVVAGASTSPSGVQKIYRDAFGTDPATWEDASPIRHVAKGIGIPDYFIAARGDDWRLQQHIDFIGALRGADVPTTVLDARLLEHADLTTVVGAPDDDVVTPSLMGFLGGCFA